MNEWLFSAPRAPPHWCRGRILGGGESFLSIMWRFSKNAISYFPLRCWETETFHFFSEHPAGNLGGRSNMGQNQVGGCYPVGPRTDGRVGCDREPGPWSCGRGALGPYKAGSSWTRHVDGRPGATARGGCRCVNSAKVMHDLLWGKTVTNDVLEQAN